MNNDQFSVRPFFRMLYGIVSVFFIFGTYVSLYMLAVLWRDKIIGFSNFLTYFLIASSFIYIGFAYTGFIVALKGKPPKYFARYLSKQEK
jgi:hypothetical protein